MAEAVQVLHDAGIAHRDIKPENIVMTNVLIGLFRMFVNCVILVGQQCVHKIVGKLIVGLQIMLPRRLSKVFNMT